MSYQIRSTNLATGKSTIVSGGPWPTYLEAYREGQRLDMEERVGSSKRLSPPLVFTVEEVPS